MTTHSMIFLILSSLATSIMLKRSQVIDGGEAAGRALSFLSHKYLGNFYGTFYDISTIIILWFAGGTRTLQIINNMIV